MSESYDFLFKFLIIGSAGSGKSCLLHQFIEKKFKGESSHTIGVEFGSKIISVGGRKVKLQIWDTAGQERFRSVTKSYYRGAPGALLVFDIANRESYNTLGEWLSDARNLASPNIVILLVGNKKDLEADRQVTFLEASRFAQENDLMYLETSAKSGENVEESFFKCCVSILSKIQTGNEDFVCSPLSGSLMLCCPYKVSSIPRELELEFKLATPEPICSTMKSLALNRANVFAISKFRSDRKEGTNTPIIS